MAKINYKKLEKELGVNGQPDLWGVKFYCQNLLQSLLTFGDNLTETQKTFLKHVIIAVDCIED